MSTENKSSVGATEKKLQVPTKTFKADGKTFRFNVAKFLLKGKEILATDALENDEILAELVDRKAGVITEVAEEKTEGGE